MEFCYKNILKIRDVSFIFQNFEKSINSSKTKKYIT